MKKKAEKTTKRRTKKSVAGPLGGLVVVVEAVPIEEGGIKIGVVRLNNGEEADEKVVGGLNVIEAFMVLAGILADGPKIVGLEMSKVSSTLLEHYQRGLDAVLQLRRPAVKYIRV